MICQSGQFELQICPNGRSKADEYYHNGLTWIEGREGSNYILRFINRSTSRVAVVFSVDGLDIINGKPAGPNSSSYVIDSNATMEVPGWVLNNIQVAQFYFAKAGKSYVTLSGNNTLNTGVIGAMVFKESQINNPNWLRNQVTNINLIPNTNNYFVTTSVGISTQKTINTNLLNGLVQQEVGTGFGNNVEFNIYNIQFTRANHFVPDSILAIYYNSTKNLQKMGIPIRTARNKYDNSTATPFPMYQSWCKPPTD
jgi:hypothetical protein